MPELHPQASAVERLGRQPTSSDDIVVMISDAIYDYLRPGSGIEPWQALAQVLEILERPLAIEIYENEMARRQPRDVDTWH